MCVYSVYGERKSASNILVLNLDCFTTLMHFLRLKFLNEFEVINSS
jgi:hypothetical protein